MKVITLWLLIFFKESSAIYSEWSVQMTMDGMDENPKFSLLFADVQSTKAVLFCVIMAVKWVVLGGAPFRIHCTNMELIWW